MCGQFTLFDDENPCAAEVVAQMNLRLVQRGEPPVKTGIVRPTDNAVVFKTQEQTGMQPVAMHWGFPRAGSSGVIINARSETAATRSLFAQSFAQRRCVVPSTGFFEWDRAGKEKLRYLFRLPDRATLYLAGIFLPVDGAPHFVILTTAASGEIAHIHDRMPVVLARESLTSWLLDRASAEQMLAGRMPALMMERY
ncbi:MAG: SOS response-associated peptidase [Oscillospiraceae bacterium]